MSVFERTWMVFKVGEYRKANLIMEGELLQG